MKNRQISNLLKQAVLNKKIVNGYLFSGYGKNSNYKYAKEFAKMVLCDEGINCNKCKSCLMFEDKNHPDYYEITKERTESIKIDEIREMQDKIIEKPIMRRKKSIYYK